MTSKALIRLTGATVEAASLHGGALILKLDNGSTVKVSGENLVVVEQR